MYTASVTNLSGERRHLIANDTEVTLICQIEPFNYSKCHRWYRETRDGQKQVCQSYSYCARKREHHVILVKMYKSVSAFKYRDL